MLWEGSRYEGGSAHPPITAHPTVEEQGAGRSPVPATPQHLIPNPSGKAVQDQEQDDAETPTEWPGASRGDGCLSLLPLAPLPAPPLAARSSPAPVWPPLQTDVGSSSTFGKSLSEPRCTSTALRLDPCAADIIFRSLPHPAQNQDRRAPSTPRGHEDDSSIRPALGRSGERFLSPPLAPFYVRCSFHSAVQRLAFLGGGCSPAACSGQTPFQQ